MLHTMPSRKIDTRIKLIAVGIAGIILGYGSHYATNSLSPFVSSTPDPVLMADLGLVDGGTAYALEGQVSCTAEMERLSAERRRGDAAEKRVEQLEEDLRLAKRRRRQWRRNTQKGRWQQNASRWPSAPPMT